MTESVTSEAQEIIRQLRRNGHNTWYGTPQEIANWINDATRQIACNLRPTATEITPVGRTGITLSQITAKRPETLQDQRTNSNTYPSMDKSG